MRVGKPRSGPPRAPPVPADNVHHARAASFRQLQDGSPYVCGRRVGTLRRVRGASPVRRFGLHGMSRVVVGSQGSASDVATTSTRYAIHQDARPTLPSDQTRGEGADACADGVARVLRRTSPGELCIPSDRTGCPAAAATAAAYTATQRGDLRWRCRSASRGMTGVYSRTLWRADRPGRETRAVCSRATAAQTQVRPPRQTPYTAHHARHSTAHHTRCGATRTTRRTRTTRDTA